MTHLTWAGAKDMKDERICVKPTTPKPKKKLTYTTLSWPRTSGIAVFSCEFTPMEPHFSSIPLHQSKLQDDTPPGCVVVAVPAVVAA